MYSDRQSEFGAADAEASAERKPSLENAIAKLELIEEDARFNRQWAIYDEAFPADYALWTVRVRRLIRHRSFDEAVALIDARDFGEGANEVAGLLRADWLCLAHDTDRGMALFEDLLQRFPDRFEVRLAYARRLLANGQLGYAHHIIGPVAGELEPGDQGLVDNIRALFSLLSRCEDQPIGLEADGRILAMKHAILQFRNRTTRKLRAGDLGRLSLVTGSLGPGGAERQLTRLAVELERARKAGGKVGSVALSRSVEIIVRSHGPQKQYDFYLPDVLAEGVEIHQIDDMKLVATDGMDGLDNELKLLLDYLPPPVTYGVRRLTAHLVESQTDTLSAWQDGACLFAGLSALLAGVPNIQLAIRGLPPSVRRHMFRPEYEVLYRAMAEVPGVTFVSNNHASAKAYADWLGIPIEQFSVVYNGVAPMKAEGTSRCEQAWREFKVRTANATQTIGGVFRFDTDKQPHVWVRFAAHYLRKHPKTRFVLVGGGRLLDGARELAEELGIEERILFTDRSNNVGYWMDKMDALVLLSRYEGLPNVLIEAQYMGVRVVTTPAGGAAECLIDGITGHVLDCCEKPDMDRLVKSTRALASRAQDATLFAAGGTGRTFLDDRFAISTMLENFVHCTTGTPKEGASKKFARRAA